MMNGFLARSARLLGATIALCGGLLATNAAHADTSRQTPGPVVLVHGRFGFASLVPIDYSYGIPADLRLPHEVNQARGLRSLCASEPISVYRAQANRIKTMGL